MPKKTELKTVQDSPPKYMSCKAAAQLLGVNTRTIYREIERGALPAYHIGTSLRLSVKDINKYLERNRVPTL